MLFEEGQERSNDSVRIGRILLPQSESLLVKSQWHSSSGSYNTNFSHELPILHFEDGGDLLLHGSLNV